METLKIPIVRCPVVVWGGSSQMSGYGSMGSAEFDSDGVERESCDDNVEDGMNEDTKFKSEFAKKLDEKLSVNYLGDRKDNRFSKSHFDDILEQTLDLAKAKEDFLRVKHENARLKFEIEKQKHEEERYAKLQMEIEYLTTKLWKMEQSRQVYEDAVSQLGPFFELFSNQSPLSPFGTNMSREDLVSRRSRTVESEEGSLSPIPSAHSRRKSTSCVNTLKKKQKASNKTESKLRGSVPALNSPASTDCASDTSSGGQAGTFRSLPRYRNRRGGREEKFRSRSRTVDCQYQRHISRRKIDVEGDDLDNEKDDLNGETNVPKKKSDFEILVLRFKTFLQRDNRYDLRKDSYKEHSSTDCRIKEASNEKSSRKSRFSFSKHSDK